MKRVLRSIIILIILLVCGFLFIYRPQMLLKNYGKVDKVSIQNGNTGQIIVLTDNEHLNHIKDNLSKCKIKLGQIGIRMGYNYIVRFYDEKDKELQDIILDSEDSVRTTTASWKVTKGKVDIKYIDKLFEEEE